MADTNAAAAAAAQAAADKAAAEKVAAKVAADKAAQEAATNLANKRMAMNQAQVDEVVEIMKMNVDKVLDRDSKLSQLDERADFLQNSAGQFEKSAGSLKNKFWLKNLKMMIIGGIVTTLFCGVVGYWLYNKLGFNEPGPQQLQQQFPAYPPGGYPPGGPQQFGPAGGPGQQAYGPNGPMMGPGGPDAGPGSGSESQGTGSVSGDEDSGVGKSDDGEEGAGAVESETNNGNTDDDSGNNESSRMKRGGGGGRAHDQI